MPSGKDGEAAALEARGSLFMDARPYSASATTDPGSLGLYTVSGRPRVLPGERFSVRVATKLPRQFYGRRTPVELQADVAILDDRGRPVHHFATPLWLRAPEPAARLRGILPSQASVGESVPLLVSFSSWKHNAVYEDCGVVRLELPTGASAPSDRIEIGEEERGVARVPVTFEKPGVYRIRIRSDQPTAGGKSFDVMSNPIRVGEAMPELRWGDLQNHSIYSYDSRTRVHMGMNAVDEIVDCRDRFALDFVTITDHAQSRMVKTVGEAPDNLDMRESDWELYTAEIREADGDGIYAFLGFEQNDYRGHTVIVNRNDGPFFNTGNVRRSYHEYWKLKGERDLLSIPHLHTLRGIEPFDRTSPTETLVEVYSQHGAYEYQHNEPYEPIDSIQYGRPPSKKHDRGERGPFVRDLLDKGFRYGFVGASDHGNAGAYGLTAAFVEDDSRDAVFDALLDRQCYATTGARILVDFQVDGHAMGRVVSIGDEPANFAPREVRLRVHARGPLERIELIRNGAVWREFTTFEGLDWETTVRDDDALEALLLEREIGDERTAYYYARVVQADGHTAWSSPVFLVK